MNADLEKNIEHAYYHAGTKKYTIVLRLNKQYEDLEGEQYCLVMHGILGGVVKHKMTTLYQAFRDEMKFFIEGYSPLTGMPSKYKDKVFSKLERQMAELFILYRLKV